MEAQKGYIIESNRVIREGTITEQRNGLVLFRFENGGAIRLPYGRIYSSEEKAKAALQAHRKSCRPESLMPKRGRFCGNAWIPF